ncbi:ATP-binding cassette domain-containing protein [Sphingobium yanoikuyae]|uniref:ATP-binding cassette domain-containing protein n=1 Tax=Sphingobium yanoikuyae TaxID=13690 RepID=A0A6P1GHL5_SPHYA|nr:peptidase domain-containing ABC transporter [Sphingobium yanoikuyae]QHD67939.1 ATP-binding cassette domain-containing protein [Sphingobium yanoikuyae]
MFRSSASPQPPVILHAEVTECGLACLAMMASYYGHQMDMTALRRLHSVSLRGLNLLSLIRIASDLKLDSRPLRVELDQLQEIRLPAIIHWDSKHFVVLCRVERGKNRRYIINDPAVGRSIVSESDFSRHFTGIVIEITPSPEFTRKKDIERVRFWEIIRLADVFTSPSIQVLLLSVFFQLFILSVPVIFSIIIDSVIPSGVMKTFLYLSAAICSLILISSALFFLRAKIISDLTHVVSLEMSTKVVRHMFSLPLSWFEKRYAGDIISRFSSANSIADILMRTSVTFVVDGLTAFLCLIALLVLSIKAFVFIATMLAVYIAIQIFLYVKIHRATQEGIIAQALDQSMILETIRGFSPIKAHGNEIGRYRKWRSLKIATVNRGITLGHLNVFRQTFSRTFADLIGAICVLGIAYEAILGQRSIGVLFVTLSYQQIFFQSMIRFTDVCFDLKLVDLHLERLSDILLSEPEISQEAVEHTRYEGNIRLQDIHYAYGAGEGEVLRGATMEIKKGETVAIIGASGAGKTTLLKIMAGLLPPTSGEIWTDGSSLSPRSLSAWRASVSYVAQDDVLYTGTIAENIAFFDEQIDMERVRNAAKAAIIHELIMTMPMRYESFVGDMGAALSGGQKARVILARSLYRNPSVLFIDEGTAHLDQETEKLVNESIERLGITRVIVAHRPSTIISAQRIFRLEKGLLSEISIEDFLYAEVDHEQNSNIDSKK